MKNTINGGAEVVFVKGNQLLAERGHPVAWLTIGELPKAARGDDPAYYIPEIPDGRKFKYQIVRNGVKISPMEFFFIAVGFPKEAAKRADADYQNNFSKDYQTEKFPGVDEMLSGLSRAGIKLGIVTSNVEPNVSLSLGVSLDYFDPNCRFMNDTHPTFSKSDSIIAGASSLGVVIDNCLYVGDQPADWEAAKTARANFLGVSYGWGISDEDEEFPVVGSATKLYEVILKMNK